jgi:hypothetical protein
MQKYLSVLRPLVSIFTVASCVAACSSSTDSPDQNTGVAAQASAASPDGQLCPVMSEYLVLTPVSAGVDPACPGVPGHGGLWKKTVGFTPVDCTPLDPSGSDATLCSYDWNPWALKPDAPPDLNALLALPGVDIASTGTTGDPACDADAMLRFATLLSLADVQCNLAHHGGPNAPKGCDVCGHLLAPGVTWDGLTVPAGSLHTMAVGMSNGTQQVVSMATPSAGTDATRTQVFLPLPAPPHGVSYVDGPALGYGYTTAGSP